MNSFLPRHHKALLFWLLVLIALVIGLIWYGASLRNDFDNAGDIMGWEYYQDQNVSFQYPKDFGTEYIRALDWPPMVSLQFTDFECVEAGEETERAGRTVKKMIYDRIYCVTSIEEGAAGSIYTQYAYATEIGEKVIILTFSTAQPQCGNFEEEEKNKCEVEQNDFDIDNLIGTIVSTLSVTGKKGVSNFQECEAAGFPIMESYPRQCRSADGILFVEKIDNNNDIGTITFTIYKGPICPVETDPPTPGCEDQPVQGQFVVKNNAGVKVLLFSTNKDGKATIRLEEGEYKLSPVENIGIGEQTFSFSVIADKETVETVNFDTGIR